MLQAAVIRQLSFSKLEGMLDEVTDGRGQALLGEAVGHLG